MAKGGKNARSMGSVIVLDQVVGADRPFVLEAYWHPREDYCSTKSKSLKFS
jgi:hypothetical protein